MRIKNIINSGLAAILFVGLVSSCAEETFDDLGDGSVTFSATIEDAPDTRALGDGNSAKSLKYAVYDSDNGELVTSGSTSVNNKTANVNLQLITGKTYDIAFFATRSSSNTYSFNATGKTVTVNYANMNSSSSTNSSFRYDDDCFHAVRKGYKAGTTSQENVILTRPMAQINFGSNDLDAEVVGKVFREKRYIYSRVRTTAYTTLDILSGQPTGEETEISIPLRQKIDETMFGAFPVGGYEYLTQAYILVGEPSPLRDITLDAATSRSESNIVRSLTIPNAPTRRNYRTNIYGSLLTSTSKWTVDIEAIYEGSFNVWNGDVKEPVKDSADENLYTVNSPAELAGLAKMVNSGNDFKGKTVMLMVDCDLNNRQWTPIGTNEHPFNGVFDGNGKTVSNLYIKLGGTSIPAGLFGKINDNSAQIKNFTIDGAEINTLAASPANYSVGAALGWTYTAKPVEGITVRNVKIEAYRWAGGVVGKGYGSVNNCTAENVDIRLSFEWVLDKGVYKWDNCDKAGAIIGQQDEGGFTLSGNRASNVTIVGYRHVGGLFGYVNYGSTNGTVKKTVSGNSINGGSLTQVLVPNYKNIQPRELIGEVSGYFGNNIDLSDNTASGVTIYTEAIVSDAAAFVHAVGEGGYVSLDSDMTISGSEVTMTKPTNINLNGHTLTLAEPMNTESELTISGEGKISNANGYALIGGDNSRIVINGGVIETQATGTVPGAVNTSGDFEMNGGELSCPRGSREPLCLNWANNTTPKTATINGGTITAHNNYALNAYAGSSPARHTLTINGGTFIGTSGARCDGNLEAVVNDGIFIKTTTSTGHAFCAGAQGGTKPCEVEINGGYFYAAENGYSICRAGNATVTVNGGYINVTGGGFALGAGKSVQTLASPATITVGGVTYSFGFEVK